MDKLKTYIASGLIALLVAFGTVVVTSAPQKAPEDNLGAISSPDIPSPYLSWGGVRQWAMNRTLNTATTTVCSIRAPLSATTTLLKATIRLDTSSTTASTVTFAKANGGAGSTTPFNAFSVSAGAQAALSLPATTTAAGMANYTFAPGAFFNVTMAGSAGTFSPTGECHAVFLEN